MRPHVYRHTDEQTGSGLPSYRNSGMPSPATTQKPNYQDKNVRPALLPCAKRSKHYPQRPLQVTAGRTLSNRAGGRLAKWLTGLAA
jgi:hypothetical protein